MKSIKIACIVLSAIFGLALIVVGVLVLMASHFNGLWKTEGYGLCIEAKHGVVNVYIVTENYYSDARAYKGYIINKTLYCGMGKFKLFLEGDKLFLHDEGARYTYVADRQEKDFLHKLHKVGADEQAEKFEMFYEAFKENYAFADMYGIDFTEEYNKYAPSISKSSSDEELYNYMCKLIDKLDDGHVRVCWGEKEYSPSDYMPEWMEDINQANLMVSVIRNNYLRDYNRFDDCYIRYGQLRKDIGYIVIQAMGMETLNKSASTKRAMDKIIMDFKDKDTIVIDLRLCSGGFDEASLVIAGYFTKEKHPAYKKQVYYNGKYTELQSIYVEPMNRTYDRDLVIITSGYTISAGETFVQAMLAKKEKNITIIGEATAGYYSDAIPMFLPGGFSFTMSTERYYLHDGAMPEGKGIVPDVHIPFNLSAFEEGRDQALDWILEVR